MQVLFGPGHGIPESWLHLRGLRVLLFTALHLASRAGTQAAPTAGYTGWVGKRQLTPGFPHSADSQDGKKKKKKTLLFWVQLGMGLGDGHPVTPCLRAGAQHPLMGREHPWVKAPMLGTDLCRSVLLSHRKGTAVRGDT